MRIQLNPLFTTPKSTGAINAIVDGLPDRCRADAIAIMAMTNNLVASQANPELDRLEREVQVLKARLKATETTDKRSTIERAMGAMGDSAQAGLEVPAFLRRQAD